MHKVLEENVDIAQTSTTNEPATLKLKTGLQPIEAISDDFNWLLSKLPLDQQMPNSEGLSLAETQSTFADPSSLPMPKDKEPDAVVEIEMKSGTATGTDIAMEEVKNNADTKTDDGNPEKPEPGVLVLDD